MPYQDIANTAVLPVFVQAINVPDKTTVVDICEATEAVAGPGTIDGATLINGLWRVLPFTEQSRIKILTEKITLRDKSFKFESINPNSRRNGGLEMDGTKLFVSNLPFSYANAAVEKNLKAAGFRLRSTIQFEKARNSDGFLTDWRTGRRTVQIEVPKIKPVKNNMKMGDFTAYLYYKEMKAQQKCFRCLKLGHKAAECPNQEVCLACEQPGHRRGDYVCPRSLDQVSEDDQYLDNDKVSQVSKSKSWSSSEVDDSETDRSEEYSDEDGKEEGEFEKDEVDNEHIGKTQVPITGCGGTSKEVSVTQVDTETDLHNLGVSKIKKKVTIKK